MKSIKDLQIWVPDYYIMEKKEDVDPSDCDEGDEYIKLSEVKELLKEYLWEAEDENCYQDFYYLIHGEYNNRGD